jgi:outer membrane protein assembly factor BamB/plastocyanin
VAAPTSGTRRARIRAASGLLCAALLTACTTSTAAPDGPATPTPTAAPEPGAVAAARAGWTVPGGDDANTRVADSTIDASNVDQLEVAWSFRPDGSGQFGAIAGEPLIADGTVYVQDLGSNLYALDLDDGSVRWEAIHDASMVGPNGPAIGDDLAFVPVGTQSVVAHDLETGEEVWETLLDSAVSQPRVVGDTVYATTNAGNYAGQTSGFVYALDAATGDERWAFQVVEEGFWGNEALNSGGGVWLPPAVDADRGHLYWGTGNPAPFPGTVDFPNASSRPGPNLYTNSLITLAEGTGELVWYDHVEPDDLFDHDFHGSPILVDDTEVDGAVRDVVVGSGKNGKVGAWDRETTERLWLVEVGTHVNAELTELPIGEPVEVYPGTLGGVETPKALADGVVYVPVVNLPTTYEATGFGASNGLEALIRLQSPPPTEGTGELVALDLATGEELWVAELDLPPFAGVTVVNDLVFTATFDGTLLAFLRDTGEEVWRFTAPAGVNAWPAVYGDTIIWGAGAGPDPQLLALRLGGGSGADAAVPGAPDGEVGDGDAEVVDGVVQLGLVTPSGSSFDRDTLTVPAGAEVVLTYDNRSDVPHNVAVFAGPDASAPVLARSDVEAGPTVQTLTFTAPDVPGEYLFHCDPHPTLMAGTLVVE